MAFLSDICPAPPNLVLFSCDGSSHPAHHDFIKVHSRILDVAKPVATVVDLQLEMEGLELEESKEDLELLLKLVYAPGITSLPFRTDFSRIVKLVEKYELFAATSICEAAMRCDIIP
jgi:hypothetical protein